MQRVNQWIPLVLLSLLVGCSDGRLPTFPVDGVIEFEDGFPVQTGRIELRCRENGIQSRGEIDGGTFTLTTYEPDDGAVAGTHDCVVVQHVIREGVEGHHGGSLGVVPPRYASYRTSDLTCTIGESPNNAVVLKLKSTAKDQAKEALEHQPVNPALDDPPKSVPGS